MKNDKILERISKFDFIKKSLEAKNTPFSMFGVECDPGWDELIFDLCEKLDFIKFSGIVMQIKEKFGGLRFYVQSATPQDYELIRAAEEKSYKTCEVCGGPGTPTDKGWIKTVCDTHAKEKLIQPWLAKK